MNETKEESLSYIKRSMRSYYAPDSEVPRGEKIFMAFAIVQHIVAYNDIEILQGLPNDMVEEIKCAALTYEEQGEYKIYSNLGCADHSDLVAKFSGILKAHGTI